MNWVEAPLSIIAEAGFQGISFLSFSFLIVIVITIGSPYPRSAELTDIPVEPNRLFDEMLTNAHYLANPVPKEPP